MYHAMTDGDGGWPWLWMVPMMLLWVVLLGGAVDGAVRPAVERSRQPESPARR